MPEQPLMPNDTLTPSWLARNRKIAILGGVVVVLAVAALVSSRLGRGTPTTSNTTTTENTLTTNTVANYARPTFQRSTVANVDTTLPESYSPPTQNDLQQGITNFNQ